MPSRRQTFLLLMDLLVLFLAIGASFALRLPHHWNRLGGYFGVLREYTGTCCLLIVTHLLCLYLLDNYADHRGWKLSRSLAMVLGSSLAAALLCTSFFYISRVWEVGRGIAAIQFITCSIGFSLNRLAAYALSRQLNVAKKTVVIGSPEAASTLIADCRALPACPIQVVAYVSTQSAGALPGQESVVAFGRSADIKTIVERYQADLIVVGLDPYESLEPAMIHDLFQCKLGGVAVMDMPALYKRTFGKVPIFNVNHMWFLLGTGFDVPNRPILRNLIRLFDAIIALAGLVLSLPLWPLIAALIKLETPGPVFYRQKRVGLGGKVFEILKFRTMVADAEKTGPQWACGPGDRRVTRFGRLLRRTRLDELPQFIQVLMGQMSVVGPRPERPEFVALLRQKIPFYDLRFAVRPGLTGWAQVNYRYGSSVEDAAVKLQYDLYYIQENSLLLYLRILLKTIRVMLLSNGS